MKRYRTRNRKGIMETVEKRSCSHGALKCTHRLVHYVPRDYDCMFIQNLSGCPVCQYGHLYEYIDIEGVTLMVAKNGYNVFSKVAIDERTVKDNFFFLKGVLR